MTNTEFKQAVRMGATDLKSLKEILTLIRKATR